jgi:hypothetical protein
MILRMASSNNTKMTREEQLYLAAIINASRHQKLHELAGIIKGTSPMPEPKAASAFDRPKKPGYLERQFKLKELGKLVRG